MPLLRDLADIFRQANDNLERGDTASAVAAFEDCVRVRPADPAALFNLANVQLQTGQMVESADTLIRCLRCAPDFGPAHVNLANVLMRFGMLDQAQEFARRGVRLMPGSPDALLCLACIQHHAGEHDAAAATYRMLLLHAPHHGGALSSLGNTLRAMGRVDEALVAHDRAIAACPAASPDHAVFRFHRATTLLASGDFAEGWAEYEWHWRRPRHPPRFTAPPWRGEPLECRSILLHHEQGLGEALVQDLGRSGQ